MRPFPRNRRDFLLALSAAALGGCAAQVDVAGERLTWPAPLDAVRHLFMFLASGLSASDILIAANSGDHGWAQLISAGVLVESLESSGGIIWTPEEIALSLVEAMPAGSTFVAPHRELGWLAGRFEPVYLELPFEPTDAGRLTRALVEQAVASAGYSGGALIFCPWFLDWQLSQPDLVAGDQLRWTQVTSWQGALKGLAAGLNWLLQELDLSCWVFVLASTCNVWPVQTLIEVRSLGISQYKILSGGSVLSVPGKTTLPLPGLSAGAQVGVAPHGPTEKRILAPAEQAFVESTQTYPQAAPRPGGFVLVLGGGVRGPYRLAPQPPHVTALLLSHLLAS